MNSNGTWPKHPKKRGWYEIESILTKWDGTDSVKEHEVEWWEGASFWVSRECEGELITKDGDKWCWLGDSVFSNE